MPGAGAPPLLEIDVRTKVHRRGAERLTVLENFRLTLVKGAVTTLLGPSGCGKTTLLRIATGLDRDFDGSVTPPPERLRLGVVFQDPRLLLWRTVEQNIRLVAPDLATADFDDLLREFGLATWRKHRPNQLSGGMARRVALARALAVQPDLLVLDEAFVSLDERNADTLRTAVFAAVARRHTTVLMVTHDIREAIGVSDTVLVLAPQPTRVADAIHLAQPRSARDATWLEQQRTALAERDQSFMRAAD